MLYNLHVPSITPWLMLTKPQTPESIKLPIERTKEIYIHAIELKRVNKKNETKKSVNDHLNPERIIGGCWRVLLDDFYVVISSAHKWTTILNQSTYTQSLNYSTVFLF